MSDKHDRDAVVARRRLMMVSALAGIAAAQAGCEKSPQPCLSIAVVNDDAAPGPCLSAPLIPADAAWASRPDAAAPTDAGPPPQPCLEVPRPKQP